MSFNQSRPDKNQEYRKSERSASSNQQHRGFSPAYRKGTAAGAGGPAPSLNNNRSFKKINNNAQGGQSRASVATVNPSDSGIASAPRGGVQNGAHLQPQLHGVSDAPVVSTAPKQTEPSAPQRSSRTVPKAPTSQNASMTSDTRAPTTPAKSPGDASKGFSFQFGSISPGLVNGMQIPARTSSAPPNLDEQKRDQARHDSFRTVPSQPTPSVPKQQLPRKDHASVDQANAAEAHLVPKTKKDVQVLPPAPPTGQNLKPSGHPMAGISMSMPFHQPQVSVQFGPNQQIQSQGMSANSMQMPMPMPLPMGSTQVQPPVFVPGLQPHPMQSQGIMHQGQNLSFTPQMGPQLPQLGNLGMGLAPQYPQQQGGKYAGPRKTPVKITHPDTHEELRLDKRTDSYSDGGSSAPRTHPNVPQSQPIPSFAPSHPPSYYTNSYTGSSLYFPAPSSHPLTSSHMPPNSQPPRFSYPVSQGPQGVPFMNPPAHNSLPVSKSGSPNLEHARDVHNLIASVPSTTIPVTVKPAGGTVGEKVVDSLPNSAAAVEKGEFPKPSRPSGEVSQTHPQRYSELSSDGFLQQSKPGSDPLVLKSLPVTEKSSVGAPAAVSVESQASNPLASASAAPSEESVPVVTTTDARSKETLSRSNSIKDQQKKPGKKGIIQQQHQVVGQSSSTSSFPSRASGHGISSSSGVPETVEANTTPAPVSSESVSESVKESLSDVNAATADVSESKAETTGEGTISISSEISGPGIAVDTSVFVHDSQVDNSSLLDEQGKHDLGGAEKQAEKSLSQGYKQDTNSCGISSEPISVKTLESVKEDAEHSVVKETTKGNAAATSETAQRGQDQNVSSHAELDGMDASSSITDSMGTNEVAFSKSGRVDQLSAPVQTTELSGAISKHEVISVENTGGGGGNIENIGSGGESLAVPGSKDKPLPELSRTKSTTSKGKKKKREILLKADAAGVNSDLYGAYKNPEEKKGIASPESTESTSTSVVSKQVAADASQQDAVVTEEDATSKAEPEDWEDAADISTPKMETSDNGEEVRGGMIHSDKDGNEHGAKKYSRDFLMMYSGKFTDLPEGFEISSDIEEILNANVNTSPSVDYDSQPSPGRIIDRPGGAARLERRGSGIIDDDRWSKGGNANFRPGQGVNYGVLRNPRAPVQHVRGILPGPTQPQGGMQRNSPDADRWQRATNFQPKGLMPSPQTPLQIMHKAERKYEVGKVSDEEQAKQRQLKAILNKLTPQNFEKLFEQVKAVNIDNATTLTGVISQIFDKALMEPTFCEMYANFCFYLSGELPDFSEDNEKVTFKRLLLNSCQMEFERGEREQEEANKADEEGEVKQSEEEREEKRIKARRRMLGNIRLIGELYKKKMLTERIMHECIKKLLGQQQTPDEEDIEALCKLMSTIGEMIDHPKAKEHMDVYFDRMKSLSNNMKLSSRVRFMLKDAIDLRRNKWQQRRKVEGPKKIEEVHRDAAQERQAQTSRLGRGPGINPSARRGAPMDFSPRGSPMLSSPNPQTGGFRGMPTQVRGYGSQDARIDERHSYESRTLSVPLTQRPLGDDSITLGPQGGLARGMSIRGSLSMSPAPLTEIPSAGDSRRMAAGLNGFSSLSERATTYLPREDLVPRHMPDRFAGPAAYDQSSAPERNINFGGRDPRNSDRSFDRSLPTSPPKRVQGAALTQNAPSEKVPTEERLRDMFLLAIKEFYSARDEKEVALCIKDLNSPSFHPLMISLWVTDSFERKDTERDLLAKLLVNLTTSHDGALSQSQLIKGFETVLSTLEDAVNDAPRAPEFLGLIFAKVILENVVSLKQIGQLIYEGGEEPGHLLKVGLAGNVLGNILEIIKSEKGESVLNEIRTASNLRLETFRPPDPHKSRILEKFI